MKLIPFVLIIAMISFILLKSIISFIQTNQFPLKHKTYLAIEAFYTLIIVYGIVIIGFGLIYFILSFQQLTLIDQNGIAHYNALSTLERALYFSGVTLLTIGYGDIAPIGIGRFIAIVQALIGYILPTAFVLKLMQVKK